MTGQPTLHFWDVLLKKPPRGAGYCFFCTNDIGNKDLEDEKVPKTAHNSLSSEWILHDFAQEFLLRNDGGKSSCVTVLHVFVAIHSLVHKSLFTKVLLVKY